MPEVISSLDIDAPPSAVWQWFETQEGLRRWLSPELEIEIDVGGAYRLLGPDRTTWITGVVLELVPQGRLVLSWLEEDREWTHPARLVIALQPIATGTRVTLTHDGFAGIGKPGWRDTRDAYRRGAARHRVLEPLGALAVAGEA